MNDGNERFAQFTDSPPPSASTTPALDQVGIDLTAHARQGKLTPVSDRDTDLERVIQVLCRPPSPRTGVRKHNVVLITDLISEPERDIRKLAIVEGLAIQMVAHRAPAVESGSAALESSWLEHCLEKLHDKRLVTLDVGLLAVGITTQREFEERFRHILDELRSSQDCIVFIDELYTFVAFAQSAYGAAEGREDAAFPHVPALARGEIQCIGATTLEEYRTYIERDPALQRRFQEVIVHEMVTTDEIIVYQRRDNDSAQGTGRRVPSPDG